MGIFLRGVVRDSPTSEVTCREIAIPGGRERVPEKGRSQEKFTR